MSNETNKPEFYTLPGLGEFYNTDDYKNPREAYDSAKKKAKKVGGYEEHQYPFKLRTEDDARALATGEWRDENVLVTGTWSDYLSSFVKKSVDGFDAVIYSDGSYYEYEDKNKGKKITCASYGVIIFTKNGDVICEAARLEDVESGEVKRDSFVEYVSPSALGNGYRSKDKGKTYEDPIYYVVINKDKPGFVTASRNIVGEMMGAQRGLEICFKDLQLSNVAIVSDCTAVEKRLNLGTQNAKDNVTYYFGKYYENEKNNNKKKATFIKVDSHGLLAVKDENFMNAVYNDMCDALAKSLVPKHKVNQKDNPNLRVALAEYTGKFNIGEDDSDEVRRRQANKLLNKLLDIKGIKPIFVSDEKKNPTI